MELIIITNDYLFSDHPHSFMGQSRAPHQRQLHLSRVGKRYALIYINLNPITFINLLFSLAIGYIIALVAILAVPFVAIFQIAQRARQERARSPRKVWNIVKELSRHTAQWRQNALNNGVSHPDGNANADIHAYDNKAMVMDVSPSQVQA